MGKQNLGTGLRCKGQTRAQSHWWQDSEEHTGNQYQYDVYLETQRFQPFLQYCPVHLDFRRRKDGSTMDNPAFLPNQSYHFKRCLKSKFSCSTSHNSRNGFEQIHYSFVKYVCWSWCSCMIFRQSITIRKSSWLHISSYMTDLHFSREMP